MLVNKAAMYTGERVQVKPFEKVELESAMRTLKENGLDQYGNEEFELPDGTPIRESIFTAPCFYQVLRHQTDDKFYGRSRGGRSNVTRQPLGGKHRNGGLRFGEMERDAVLSHGCSAILTERLMTVSDKYTTAYCVTCGTIATKDLNSSSYKCLLCGDKARIGSVTHPYVFKLISHMLMAMGIRVTLKLEEAVKRGDDPDNFVML
jgi:DNA-directed RNA polymerase II subunit RPB2